MSDLVKRLRETHETAPSSEDWQLCCEAADEIERLQRLNATYVRDGYASLDAKDREIEQLNRELDMACNLLQYPYDPTGQRRLTWYYGYWIDEKPMGKTMREAIRKAAETAKESKKLCCYCIHYAFCKDPVMPCRHYKARMK